MCGPVVQVLVPEVGPVVSEEADDLGVALAGGGHDGRLAPLVCRLHGCSPGEE